MTYDAEYDDTVRDIECKDEPHDSNHAELGKCPFNICQCDRTFARGLLENYKRCIQGVSDQRDFHEAKNKSRTTTIATMMPGELVQTGTENSVWTELTLQ